MTISNLRVVVDTGVVVSAVLLPRSVPRQALDAAASLGRLLVSQSTIAELEEVLRRTKFNKYIPEPMRLEFLAALVRDAEVVDVAVVLDDCRDPKDNKFLELAVEGMATHLISSDAHLLELHPFRGVPILSPNSFLEKVQSP